MIPLRTIIFPLFTPHRPASPVGLADIFQAFSKRCKVLSSPEEHYPGEFHLHGGKKACGFELDTKKTVSKYSEIKVKMSCFLKGVTLGTVSIQRLINLKRD